MTKRKRRYSRRVELTKCDIEYKKLQEIRRRYLYQQMTTKQLSFKLHWPLSLNTIRLESYTTYKKKQKAITLTSTSSYSTQDLITNEFMKEEKTAKVNIEQLETFSMNHLQQYTEQKLKQLGIQLSPSAIDQCLNNSVSLINKIMKEYSSSTKGRVYKLKNRNPANWMDIILSAMRSNISKSVIQKVYHKLKDRFPENSEGMEIIMTDFLNKKEEDNIDSYLSNSIFDHTTPVEDFLMQKLSDVENDIYKNEPTYMDITKLNIPDTKRIADAVEIIYSNKK